MPLRPIRRALAVILAACSLAPAAEVPSPESHLGYRPGADFRLADWPSVVDYFRKVDRASERVAVLDLGPTTEGRPLIAAIVSNEATIHDLDRFKKLQEALANPSDDEGAGRRAVLEGKPVVLITCSIHSNETASTLMSLELLHDLASKDDPSTREVLDHTILILVPSVNPDGVDKVASWYERTRGKPFEGEGMPWLYHHYAGHDTNRDWFMLNLKETQHLTRLLYKEWFPTIAYDVHQMGSKGARLFVPPFHDPINPNVDPRIVQGIFQIGAHMAADLASSGKQGVLTNAMYDNWMSGGNRTTTHRHNIVAVLTEAASVKLASPIYVEKADLKGATRGFTSHDQAVNFTDPWPGGWWRLRDIVDYELIASKSLLTLAARYRQQFQANYLAIGREAIRKGREEPPFAWIIPRDQRDPGTASKLVGILQDSGIKVHRAKSSFVADGVPYPEGSWVLPAAQPYRAHLKDVMERQIYPNRIAANGTPEPPYDNAGWTMPLQMGVTAAAVGGKFAASTEEVGRVEPPRGMIGGTESPEFYTIRNQANDDFRVLNALLAAGLPVQALRQPAHSGSEELPAGTLIVKATPEARGVLDKVLAIASSKVEGRVGLTALPNDPKAAPINYRKPRVAHYQPWVPNMDEGWLRFVLDSSGFPYEVVHDAEVRAGHLGDRFDTLVLASISPRSLREGLKADATEPSYVGGLGREGAESIRDFVRGGGTLVCMEASTAYAIEEFGLPATNVLKDLKPSEFYSPGSIFRVELAKSTDPHGRATQDALTVGMPDEYSAWFDNSPAFALPPQTPDKMPNPGKVVASYAKINTLDSGWLVGADKVQGKAALVEFPEGRGRVVLFGFSPHHRGQPHGTYRLLFNALYPIDRPDPR